MLKRSKEAAVSFDKEGSMSEISHVSRSMKPIATFNHDATMSFIGGATPHSSINRKLHDKKRTETRKELKISKEDLVDEIEKINQR